MTEFMPDQAATAPPAGVWLSLPAEDRFAHLVEAVPTALILTGRSGRIELVNRRAERLFGYDDNTLLGQPVESLLPQRFRDDHVALRKRFLTDMSTRMMGTGQFLYGLRRDGTEFALEIALNPIDIDGEPMVLAGILDITARSESERESGQQRQELERSNVELQEFAYAASHDLKAPLRAIAHLVQWIGEDIAATASAETLENLRLLRGRAARLQTLLDGLLAYSRVGDTTHSDVEDVDVSELVREVSAMLGPPAGFVIACEGPMAVMRTHRTPMRVVLENLIGNAIKHHDRAQGRITINARRIDGATEFRVTDDGPGIEPRFHDRVFVIFQTLASRDDIEASGIGLSIVKKKVQAHGGRIWIESAPPLRGTSFVFTWKETT